MSSLETGEAYLHKHHYFYSKSQKVGCLACGTVWHCSICLKHTWEFVGPHPFMITYPHLQVVLNDFVGNFHLSIGLREYRRGEAALDSQL